ncbi:MAG: VWA domain-containing protein [Blastocatellia bacterium]|nr:VWA domain-containing protein [Blastocatellia bacterium]
MGLKQFLHRTILNGLILALAIAPNLSALGQAKRERNVKPNPAQKPAQKPPTTSPAKPTSPPVALPKPTPAAEEPDEVLRIESKLVAVPVSVTDTKGEPIRGLKPEDFQLEEEGRQQQLVALGDPGQTPVELSLVFDVSGSVYERFRFQQEAAARFLKQVMKPKDAVSVFAIGLYAKMAIGRTNSFDTALAGLMGITPTKEGTAFFDTVGDAATYIGKTAEPGTRHVIVVISDGEDNNSDRFLLRDVSHALQRNDCLFYSINPSGPSIWLNKVSVKGQQGMSSLAQQTGGAAFLPERFEDLDAVFRQIAAELQAQYLLGYYSTDDRADGGFRKIAVNVPKRPDLRVRARQGYYAPKV